MKKIKPIDTPYNGYLFRSRLEARWAVFLDTLGIAYNYEREGYDLDDLKYLPDFWLPGFECWLEIKGDMPNGSPGFSAEWNKPGGLAAQSHQLVHLFPGQISAEPSGFSFSKFEKTDLVRIAITIAQSMDITRYRCPPELLEGLQQFGQDTSPFTATLKYIEANWTEEPSTNWGFLFDGIATVKRDTAQIYLTSRHYLMATTTRWVECAKCQNVGIASKLLPWIRPCDCEYPIFDVHTPRLDAAYRAGRQARFEFDASTKYTLVPPYTPGKERGRKKPRRKIKHANRQTQ